MTGEQQTVESLMRRIERLEDALAYSQVRIADVPDTPPPTVYEFAPCSQPLGPCGTAGLDERLYATNPECAKHVAGGELENELVAAINRSGEIECWTLLGVAPRLVSGESLQILAWHESCEDCSPPCYSLFECGNPTNNFQVRGYEWAAIAGRIVKIDGTCYTVSSASITCGSPSTITVDDIEACYRSCASCAVCYEITACGDPLDVRYLADDLAGLLDEDDPEDTIGTVFRLFGVCYEITDTHETCPETPELIGLTSIETVESCAACCYMLVPCDPEGTTLGPYHFTPADPDPTEFVNEDGTSNGRVIRLGNQICYTVESADNCTEASVGIGTVIDEYDSCECCKVYCLQECGTSNYLKTLNDLCEYETGSVLKRAEDTKCYELLDSIGPCSALSHSTFTVEEVYADSGSVTACEQCDDPKYVLIPSCNAACDDCASGGTEPDNIVTREDLQDHVGRYVKVDGVCYLVTLPESSVVVTDETLSYSGPFDTCEACAAAPSCLEVMAKRGGEEVWLKIVGPFTVCAESDVPECGG